MNFLLLFWKPIAVAVAVIGLTVAWRVQTARLDTVKREYAAFQAQVKALGDVAEAKARAKEKADLAIKTRIDHENKTLRATLAAESKRMSDARAGSSFLPQPSTGTPSPTVTADRAKLETALRDFDTAVAGLVDEGDRAIADLNSAKSWASQVKYK